jgi:hypothetical protein
MTGDAMMIWTVRIALVLYAAALGSRLLGGRRWLRSSRLLWSGGLLFYLAHVVAAFHFVHAWSHERARVETARQTRELFGVDSGLGLWLNYAFTIVWIADALWWWFDEAGYLDRPRWIGVATQAFTAFMFFNGAVVFGHGLARWLGLALAAALIVLWLRSRREGPPARW